MSKKISLEKKFTSKNQLGKEAAGASVPDRLPCPLPCMCGKSGRPTKPLFWPLPGPCHSPKGPTIDSNPFSTTLMAPLNEMRCQLGQTFGAMMMQSQAWWETGVPAQIQARKNGRVPENQFLANSAKIWSNRGKCCTNKSCGLWLR